jgi:hypothetical protein
VIYVVLGMHKSGTTLVSQILHHSGINMDDRIDPGVSYDGGNKYERQAVLHLNMRMLNAPDDRIIDVKPLPAFETSPENRDRIAAIVAEAQARHADWGFKDPRTCLTYPLWAEALPEHRIIAVYREAGEVWPRYRMRRWYYFLHNFDQAWRYLNRWYEHNANLLDFLAATRQPYIVLDYRRLMTGDEEFRRLEEFVGRPLEDRRRPELYRGHARPSIHIASADWRLRHRCGRGTRDLMRELDRARASNGAG